LNISHGVNSEALWVIRGILPWRFAENEILENLHQIFEKVDIDEVSKFGNAPQRSR